MYLLKSAFVLTYGEGAVVVMDNLPAHKRASIAPKIEAVGASIIY